LNGEENHGQIYSRRFQAGHEFASELTAIVDRHVECTKRGVDRKSNHQPRRTDERQLERRRDFDARPDGIDRSWQPDFISEPWRADVRHRPRRPVVAEWYDRSNQPVVPVRRTGSRTLHRDEG
jgi:hypothetical protein